MNRRFYFLLGIVFLAALLAGLLQAHTTILALRPYWVDPAPGWTQFYQEHLTLWEYRFVLALLAGFGLPALALLKRAQSPRQ